MKFRNKFIAKRIGTKTLASLLAFGMALGSPMAAFADDGETVVVAENTVQAKKTDGSEAFVSVSDCVRGMMESGAVRLNNETGYLEDTSTGQKVDPETGERLTETPDVPETPAIPDTPGNQENPESPDLCLCKCIFSRNCPETEIFFVFRKTDDLLSLDQFFIGHLVFTILRIFFLLLRFVFFF